jgi:ketopantoate reductase
MKILVFGAGVVGTLYAARLQEAGHQVTVLARNSRLADVRRHGLVLEDVLMEPKRSCRPKRLLKAAKFSSEVLMKLAPCGPEDDDLLSVRS